MIFFYSGSNLETASNCKRETEDATAQLFLCPADAAEGHVLN